MVIKMYNVQKFDDIIGNNDVKQVLMDAISSAKTRNTYLDHVLLSGSSGIGKTMFATVIANEMGVTFDEVLCDKKSLGGLNTKLLRMKERSILFLDEIHIPSDDVRTGLYKYFDQGKVLFTYSNRVSILRDAKRVTIVAATTDIAKLDPAFINRFPINIRLTGYSDEDLMKIVDMNAKSEGLTLLEDAIKIVARATKGVPRDCHNLIRRIRDHIIVNYKNESIVTDEMVLESLRIYGIDRFGLSKIDRMYIVTLFDIFNNEPTGISSIANQLQIEEQVLLKDYEGYLLRSGIIMKTARGRNLTDKGMDYALSYVENEGVLC